MRQLVKMTWVLLLCIFIISQILALGEKFKTPVISGNITNDLWIHPNLESFQKTPEENLCEIGETQCPFKDIDGKQSCLKSCQKCDGNVDCPRATDEVGCPCRSKLISEYICDGKVDCTDLSDELGCGDCMGDELRCSEGCVQLSSFCEGVSCGVFNRNLLCSRLSLRRTADDSSGLIHRSIGYLQMRVRGKWLSVCGYPGEVIRAVVDSVCFDITGIEHSENSIGNELVASPPQRWAYFEKENKIANNESLFLAVESENCSSNSVVYVKCQQPSCQNNSISTTKPLSFSRIVGGNNAAFDMWNFMVDILRNGIRYCGGTVLNSRWILSASHCYLKIAGNLFEIEAGSHIKNTYSPHSQRIVVSHVIRHSDFNPYEMRNDIALLRLMTPLQLNRWVRPVCVTNGEDISLKVGVTCTVGGWGFVHENGTLAKTLQEVTVPILEGDVCVREYVYVDSEKVFCAGHKAGGKDSCQGDSGGPMMCNVCGKDDDPITCKRKPWVQAGIVSYGRGCARPGMPGVYTKIESYKDWIFNTTNADITNLPMTVPSTECDGILCQLTIGLCLDKKYVCDGKVDCIDAADEKNCDEMGFPKTNNIESTTEFYSTTNIMEIDNGDSIPNNNTEGPNNSCQEKNHYRCEISLECIPIFLVCDEVRDCRDGSDEWKCSCVDRLVVSEPSKICDGIIDCFDGKDEAAEICTICKPGYWFCSRSRECVRNEWRCDEKVNCRYGEDELYCLALVPNDEGQLFMNKIRGVPKQSDRGHLLIYSNENSKWTPVCTNELLKTYGDSVCSFLGFGPSKNISYNKNLPTDYDAIGASSKVKRSLEDPEYKSLGPPTLGLNHHVEKRSARGFKGQRHLLRDLRQSGYFGDGETRHKRDTCNQVHIECGPKPCGRISDLNLSDSPPVGYASEIPWEVSLYVSGKYICGATIVHKEWVITSSKCVMGIDLTKSELHVVGGSQRETRTISSARILGFEESDFRVDSVVDLDSSFRGLNSRLSLLHLNKSIENSGHFSTVCLSTNLSQNMNVSWKECVVAGKHRDVLTYSLLLVPEASQNCSSDEICFQNFTAEHDVCTSNWSGLISCRHEHSTESSWTAAGIWTFLGDDKLCGSKKYSHKLITKEIVEIIRNITSKKVAAPSSPVPCHGQVCPFGVCVPETGICDGVVSCANLEDEHYRCPIPVPYCTANPDTNLCECPGNLFACSDRICIHPKRLCDGISDCPNNEDENCTCILKTSTMGKVDVCNGVVDCYDQSDELHCHCNLETEYRCYRSPNQTCIDRQYLCDNVTDCENGEDEETCFTLSSTVFVEENALAIPAVDPEGYLLIRIMGRWFTYLIEKWNNMYSDRVCVKLGFQKSSGTFGRLLNLTTISKEYQRSNNVPITAELFRGNSLSIGNQNNVTYISCIH